MPEETNSKYQEMLSGPEVSTSVADKRPLFIGIGVAILIIVLFVGGGWLLFIYPVAAARLRDIVIIFMGIGSLLVILLLVALVVITTYLVLKVNDLVKLVKEVIITLNTDVKPVLGRVQETVGTVKGTTTFISDHAVQPVITTAASVTALRTIVRSLFSRD